MNMYDVFLLNTLATYVCHLFLSKLRLDINLLIVLITRIVRKAYEGGEADRWLVMIGRNVIHKDAGCCIIADNIEDLQLKQVECKQKIMVSELNYNDGQSTVCCNRRRRFTYY
jgi:hypothetical protein